MTEQTAIFDDWHVNQYTNYTVTQMDAPDSKWSSFGYGSTAEQPFMQTVARLTEDPGGLLGYRRYWVPGYYASNNGRGCFLQHGDTMLSPNHSVTAEILFGEDLGAAAGPFARMSGTPTSFDDHLGYYARVCDSDTPGEFKVELRYVDGANSIYSNTAGGLLGTYEMGAYDSVYRNYTIKCDWDTISVLVDGVERISVTDDHVDPHASSNITGFMTYTNTANSVDRDNLCRVRTFHAEIYEYSDFDPYGTIVNSVSDEHLGQGADDTATVTFPAPSVGNLQVIYMTSNQSGNSVGTTADELIDGWIVGVKATGTKFDHGTWMRIADTANADETSAIVPTGLNAADVQVQYYEIEMRSQHIGFQHFASPVGVAQEGTGTVAKYTESLSYGFTAGLTHFVGVGATTAECDASGALPATTLIDTELVADGDIMTATGFIRPMMSGKRISRDYKTEWDSSVDWAVFHQILSLRPRLPKIETVLWEQDFSELADGAWSDPDWVQSDSAAAGATATVTNGRLVIDPTTATNYGNSVWRYDGPIKEHQKIDFIQAHLDTQHTDYGAGVDIKAGNGQWLSAASPHMKNINALSSQPLRGYYSSTVTVQLPAAPSPSNLIATVEMGPNGLNGTYSASTAGLYGYDDNIWQNFNGRLPYGDGAPYLGIYNNLNANSGQLDWVRVSEIEYYENGDGVTAVTAESDGRGITLSWTDDDTTVPAPTEVVIQRKHAEGTNVWEDYGSVAQGVETFRDRACVEGDNYTYRVSARNATTRGATTELAATGPSPVAVTFVGSNYGNVEIIDSTPAFDLDMSNIPHQEGDFAIMMAACDQDDTTFTVGQGWTQHADYPHAEIDGTDRTVDIWYKHLTSSELDDLTITAAGTMRNRSYSVHVFRGVDPVNWEDVANVQGAGLNIWNPNTEEVTTATSGAVVLAFSFVGREMDAVGVPNGYTAGESHTFDVCNTGFAYQTVHVPSTVDATPWNNVGGVGSAENITDAIVLRPDVTATWPASATRQYKNGYWSEVDFKSWSGSAWVVSPTTKV